MIIKVPDLRHSSHQEIYKWIHYLGNIDSKFLNELKQEITILIKNDGAEILPKFTGYINSGDSLSNFISSFPLSFKVNTELHKEYMIFYEGIFFLLNKYFGKVKRIIANNKIIDLVNAKNCGLEIPDTIITTSKKELIKFYNKNTSKKIITKSLGGSLRFETEDEILWGKGTTIVTMADINSYLQYIFPSIFQVYIEKQYEIRSFYFKGEFYSMAIFSQTDEKTVIDFRNYNKEKPNRMVPFKLPIDIESKLKVFMEISDLDTGSIDLIVTKNEEEFVFLEVNPFGQFGWLSKNCNYYIEKRIAKYFEEYEN